MFTVQKSEITEKSGLISLHIYSIFMTDETELKLKDAYLSEYLRNMETVKKTMKIAYRLQNERFLTSDVLFIILENYCLLKETGDGDQL